jgi:hypothetical protein
MQIVLKNGFNSLLIKKPFSRIKILYLIIFLTIGIIIGFSNQASAVDYILGAKGGYFIWDPWFKEFGGAMSYMKKGDGALYGPVASVMFTQDLSFSMSGLFGKQSAHWQSEDFTYKSNEINYRESSFDIKRIDVDAALSYRLSEYFKIFAGYKYMYNLLQYKHVNFNRNTSTNSIDGEVEKSKIKIPYNGGAIGLGLSLPIKERFFFATNLSAIYIVGKMHVSGDIYYYQSGSSTRNLQGGGGPDGKVHGRGINCEPTIGASMGEGMPIFAIGVRFQWMQFKIVGDDKKDTPSSWSNDYIYGIFVSVIQPI